MRPQITIEKISKALGNDRRLEIIRILKDVKHRNVSDFSRMLSISEAAASKHLSLLERAGILVRVRRGMFVLYRLSLEQPEPAKTVLKML